MNFSEALHSIKSGQPLKRSGWNSQNQFVFLVDGARHGYELIGPNARIDIEPMLVIYTPKFKVFSWTPSSADLLADDWEIAECDWL